ncbi:MAG: hypothetical protein CM15mP102_03540 [Flavobacteriales bacterium]|nr:MAG: hypothetical protein CM15mP102_03540 [Flavobacteriales bacterium]
MGNAEICKRKKVGLLAYSPLGFGVFQVNIKWENPEYRLKLFSNLARFSNDNALKQQSIS